MIKKHSLLIIVVLSLLVCLWALFYLLLPLDVFIWDESHHGFYGLQIYYSLRAADWGAFWEQTNRQALWMPLHSWLNGIFLLCFGFSFAAARASSLFLFFWCAILIFFIGREFAKERGSLIGLIASVLFLTSPILLNLATVNMQEMLGLTIVLGLTCLLVKQSDNNRPWVYLTAGFLASLAYWAKSNYALQLIFGLGLFQLSLLWPVERETTAVAVTAGKKGQKKAIKQKALNSKLAWLFNNLYLICGFLPLFVLWWLTPPWERKYALGFIFRTQGMGEALFYPSVNILGRAIFYLQSLMASYTFSLWLGLGLILALVAAGFYWSEKKVRLLFCLFAANLVMISLVGNIQERYLATSAPMAFLLLAVLALKLWEKFGSQNRFRILVIAAAGLIAALVFVDGWGLLRYTKQVANRSILFPIYREEHNKYEPPFLFGLAKRPGWTYPMAQTKRLPDFPAAPKTTITDVLAYFKTNVDPGRPLATFISYHELSPYDFYWYFHDWGAPVSTGNDFQLAPGLFWQADYFLELKPSKGSPYEPEWLDQSWNKYSPILFRNGYITLASQKEFQDLGLTAYIYKRVKSF